jgi:hypothetical protein
VATKKAPAPKATAKKAMTTKAPEKTARAKPAPKPKAKPAKPTITKKSQHPQSVARPATMPTRKPTPQPRQAKAPQMDPQAFAQQNQQRLFQIANQGGPSEADRQWMAGMSPEQTAALQNTYAQIQASRIAQAPPEQRAQMMSQMNPGMQQRVQAAQQALDNGPRQMAPGMGQGMAPRPMQPPQMMTPQQQAEQGFRTAEQMAAGFRQPDMAAIQRAADQQRAQMQTPYQAPQQESYQDLLARQQAAQQAQMPMQQRGITAQIMPQGQQPSTQWRDAGVRPLQGQPMPLNNLAPPQPLTPRQPMPNMPQQPQQGAPNTGAPGNYTKPMPYAPQMPDGPGGTAPNPVRRFQPIMPRPGQYRFQPVISQPMRGSPGDTMRTQPTSPRRPFSQWWGRNK